jgi:hypothetical protein
VTDYRVSCPHFSAWVHVKDGHIFRAADVVGWAKGASWEWYKDYMKTKYGEGFRCQRLR